MTAWWTTSPCDGAAVSISGATVTCMSCGYHWPLGRSQIFWRCERPNPPQRHPEIQGLGTGALDRRLALPLPCLPPATEREPASLATSTRRTTA